MINKKLETSWSADQQILTADGFYLFAEYGTIKVNVPAQLPYRKIYVAAIEIPDPTAGYVLTSKAIPFKLAARQEGNEVFSMQWGSDNSSGTALVDAPGITKNIAGLRPQFRWSLRPQVTLMGSGYDAPMVPGGMETVFRTQAGTGLFQPTMDAYEWLVQCAPMPYLGSVTEFTLTAAGNGNTGLSVFGMFLGVLSANEAI